MAKITLNTILSSFASTSLFNTNFSAIEDELNDKVLYRNNPTGEANEMLNDLDMNSNDILNTGTVNATSLVLNGQTVAADSVAAQEALNINYDNTSSGLTAVNVQAAIDEVEARQDTGSNWGRNLIINGDFSVWQRGTSQTSSGYGSDDRWRNDHAGTTKTHSRQAFTIGQTDVPNNPKYFSRTVVSSVSGASNLCIKYSKLEDVRKSSGQEVTLSFYAKADSNKNIAVDFEQFFGTGGSPSASVNGIGVTTVPLTTSWQRFTITATFPSISGKTLGTNGDDDFRAIFWFDAGSDFDIRTNSLGQQSGTFDIANVQLEFGDTATDFEYVSPADQLARCQRYYQKSYPQNLAPYTATTTGIRIDRSPTTTGTVNIPLVTNMRIVPNISLINPVTSANNSWRDFNAGADRSVTFANASENHFYVDVTSTVAGNIYGGHWVVDAEL